MVGNLKTKRLKAEFESSLEFSDNIFIQRFSSDIIEARYSNFFYGTKRAETGVKFDSDPWMDLTREVCDIAFAILIKPSDKSLLIIFKHALWWCRSINIILFNLVDGHRGHTRSRVTCLSSLMSVKQSFDKILGNVCSQQDLKTIRG